MNTATFIAIGTSLLGMLLAAAPARAGGPEPLGAADLDPVWVQPAGDHAPVVLVEDGRARAKVFVAAKGGPALATLLKELVAAVKETTGAELEVVREMPAADVPAVVIGDCDASRAAGIDPTKLPIEGFAIRTAPNRVFIVGSVEKVAGAENEADAWGVADFLERHVGVRWYWPADRGGRSVQPRKTLAVAPANYTDAPAYRMRVGWPPFYNAADGAFHVQALYHKLRGGNSWPTRLRVHQPSQWDQVYAKQRPEIFALRPDGTRNVHVLCYGNARTRETFLENIEAHYAGSIDDRRRDTFIHGDTITVSPADTGITCACPDCQKLLEPAAGRWASASRLLGTFVSALAADVKKRWPDKTVLYLPYVNYTLAPEGIVFGDNVEVQLCGMPGVAMYKEPALAEQFQRNIDRWAKLTGRKVQTWDYSCWPTDRTKAMYQYPHVLADYYRRNRDKLVGTFINGGLLDEWTRHHVSMYCWMKLLWDPAFDVDAAMEEYCRRMYGPAAGEVRELLRLQCDRWEQVRWPLPTVSPKAVHEVSFPREVVAKMKELLEQARGRAADDEAVSARLAFFAAPFEAFFAESASVHEGAGLRGLVAPKVAEAPVVDGKLDDACWALAEPVTLVRSAGDRQVDARYRTEVRMVWTLEGVAVAMRMAEPNPKALVRDIKTSDDPLAWHNDNVEVFLDVTGQKEGRYYQFIINPNPAVWDGKDGDATWSAEGMKLAVQVGDDCWTVEMYLPLAALAGGLRPGTGVAWAGQFTRHRISDGRTNRSEDNYPEYSRLNFRFGGGSANVADFGMIRFVE